VIHVTGFGREERREWLRGATEEGSVTNPVVEIDVRPLAGDLAGYAALASAERS
jgi:hypothetical protein